MTYASKINNENNRALIIGRCTLYSPKNVYFIEHSRKENEIIAEQLADEVFEEFLHLDWAEELCEEELGMQKLDEVRPGLPSEVQAEIYEYDKQTILTRLTEEVYFDIIRSYVGGYWLENLTWHWLSRARGRPGKTFEDLFVLHSTNPRASECINEAFQVRSVYTHLINLTANTI